MVLDSELMRSGTIATGGTILLNDKSLDEYAHGFIEQGSDTAVRYHFTDSFDDDNDLTTPAIDRWLTAKGQSMENSINSAYSAWKPLSTAHSSMSTMYP